MNQKLTAFMAILWLSLLIIPASLANTAFHSVQIGEADDETPADDIIRASDETQIDVIGEIKTFMGLFESDDDEILVQILNLNAGDTIYAYAAGVGLVDTYMYLLDESMSDVFIEDNNGGGGYNSALSYEVQEAGTYVIGLITRANAGEFRLVVGVNTPEVITIIDEVPTEDIGANFEAFDCASADSRDRPILSGTVLKREASSFVIHYTLEGSDATTDVWVDELETALQLSLDVQFNDLGWALPPADCGEGGDTRLDVYVLDIDFAFGVATPENLVGDNPNTDVTEYYAAYSHLLIENDLDFIEDRDLALDMMRTTAAHEVHHNIQFGYDVNDRFFGFYEAGATWIETLVYPELSNAGASTEPVFNAPDRCLGSFRGRGTGDLRVYGEWLVIDSFTQDLGIRSYQFIWEYMATNEGLDGFYRALAELGTSADEVILRMAVRNLLHDYTLGEFFGDTVRIEEDVEGYGQITPKRNGIQQLAVDYVHIADRDIYTFEVESEALLELFVVGINKADDSAHLYSLGTGGTVDTSIYDDAYIIILNTEQHSDTRDCSYSDWELDISEARDSILAEPDSEIWDASNFTQAR